MSARVLTLDDRPNEVGWRMRFCGSVLRFVSALAVPTGAFAAALLLFGVFIACTGRSPASVYYQMYRGSFGTWFSFQNTLMRAAPLMLTALATALPLRLGLVVLGGEGSMVIGGLAAAASALAAHEHSPAGVKVAMLAGGALVGGLWMALSGALRALSAGRAARPVKVEAACAAGPGAGSAPHVSLLEVSCPPYPSPRSWPIVAMPFYPPARVPQPASSRSAATP